MWWDSTVIPAQAGLQSCRLCFSITLIPTRNSHPHPLRNRGMLKHNLRDFQNLQPLE